MVARQNPSGVWHTVNPISDECCSASPCAVLIPVVHKKSQGRGELTHVLCLLKPALPSGRLEFRVPTQAGGRQEAFSSPAGLSKGSLLCSHTLEECKTGFSLEASAVRFGG